jgi:hypothetical protein
MPTIIFTGLPKRHMKIKWSTLEKYNQKLAL